MWKIISLFTLLVLAQAADIDDIYGDWWEVAFYPVSTYTPLCIRFRFAKSEDEVNCTFGDGRNATLVLATMMIDGQIKDRHYMPMIMVDTPAEVMPALNISVKCDGREMRDRAVVRLVNEDYFILYANIPASIEYTRSEIEQNSAILFGRNLVSSEQLGTVMMNIEDLKNRRGAQTCGTWNYGGFKSTGNEIKN